jgi:hypothetical protein
MGGPHPVRGDPVMETPTPARLRLAKVLMTMREQVDDPQQQRECVTLARRFQAAPPEPPQQPMPVITLPDTDA